MKFQVCTLHPDIFTSFKAYSLIARGQAQDIISIKTVNWRDNYGAGNHKQVDDKPYGRGSGMLLQAEPIFKALQEYQAISPLYTQPKTPPPTPK